MKIQAQPRLVIDQVADRAPPARASVGGGRAIALHRVGKAFGDRVALADLSLEIPAGQFVAVVGRSGGGKTTLLRLVAGLDRPTDGHIRISGQPVTGLQPDVRLLFQDARLLPWHRVIGNVGIARDPAWRETARAALMEVGLADRGNDWPAVLSGGQRQRVALARALVSRPAVLLLDEPFGALDALTRVEMHVLLEKIWREHGFTIVLITHDVAEAIALADRVIVLRDGAVALDLAVDLPRPRREGRHPGSAELRAHILEHV